MAKKLLSAFVTCVASGLRRLRRKENNESYPGSNPTQQQETLYFCRLAFDHAFASVVNLFRDFHIDRVNVRGIYSCVGLPTSPPENQFRSNETANLSLVKTQLHLAVVRRRRWKLSTADEHFRTRESVAVATRVCTPACYAKPTPASAK